MTCGKIVFCFAIVLNIFPILALPVTSNSEEYVSRPLTKNNYKRIFKTNKYVFVKFYTDWCYFSKQIFDIWENVGEHFQAQQDVLIADFDCGKYKTICQSFNVREYPTLIMFKNGKRFEKYIGARTTNDIVGYLNKFIEKRKAKDKKKAKKKA